MHGWMTKDDGIRHKTFLLMSESINIILLAMYSYLQTPKLVHIVNIYKA